MIQQKIYFTDTTYNRMYEDGYLGNANIIFENAICRDKIFEIGKQSHFYIVDEDLKQRIDKAIEYIENKTVKVKYKEIGITEKRLCLIHNQVDYLLDILKGSDENEKEED